METISHGGVAYPVTDAWHAQNTTPWPDLASAAKQDVDNQRKALQQISNLRPLSTGSPGDAAVAPGSNIPYVDPNEVALLKALDCHWNVRNAIDFLGGRSHIDFGFTGLDQVHGNIVHSICGCRRLKVHDDALSRAVAASGDVQATAALAAAVPSHESMKTAPASVQARVQDILTQRTSAHAAEFDHQSSRAGVGADVFAVGAMDVPSIPHAIARYCHEHAALAGGNLDKVFAQIDADCQEIAAAHEILEVVQAAIAEAD